MSVDFAPDGKNLDRQPSAAQVLLLDRQVSSQDLALFAFDVPVRNCWGVQPGLDRRKRLMLLVEMREGNVVVAGKGVSSTSL